jgi:hypothetical protein
MASQKRSRDGKIFRESPNIQRTAPGACSQLFDLLARPERFELPTPWFVARYSIQLSYGRAVRNRMLSQD